MWPLGNSRPATGAEKRGPTRPRKAMERRRRTPRWRRWTVLVAAFLIPAVALAGSAYWAWTSHGPRTIALAEKTVLAAFARAGLSVGEVFVQGRIQTPLEDVARAVAVKRGDNILAFDAAAARARLVALGWVRDATVTRRLPSEIHVVLIERTPVALYQRAGKHALIDGEGAVITRRGLDRFAKLPLVVGKGARAHAGALIALLASQPALFPKVEAAVRVGDRRWNVRMRNGIEINLPADKAIDAWAKLAELEVKHGIFKRDVSTIDLRLPDRLVVRMTPGGASQWRLKGKKT